MPLIRALHLSSGRREKEGEGRERGREREREGERERVGLSGQWCPFLREFHCTL